MRSRSAANAADAYEIENNIANSDMRFIIDPPNANGSAKFSTGDSMTPVGYRASNRGLDSPAKIVVLSGKYNDENFMPHSRKE